MKIIIPIILLALAGGLYLGYIDGAYDQVKTLQAEEEEYDRALQQSEDLNAIHDRLLATYNGISSTDLDRLRKLLPENIDSIRLLIDIDGIAAENGLALSGLNADVEQAADEPGEIGTVRVRFTTVAPYLTFKDFLRDLEASLRIFNIDSISFTSGQTGTGLLYTVSFETYWMN